MFASSFVEHCFSQVLGCCLVLLRRLHMFVFGSRLVALSLVLVVAFVWFTVVVVVQGAWCHLTHMDNPFCSEHVCMRLLDLTWPLLAPSLDLLQSNSWTFIVDGASFRDHVREGLQLRVVTFSVYAVSRGFGIDVDELSYVHEALVVYHSAVELVDWPFPTLRLRSYVFDALRLGLSVHAAISVSQYARSQSWCFAFLDRIDHSDVLDEFDSVDDRD